MNEYIQVITTINNKEAAERIASYLVESRLVACAQVSGPITSVYRWKGNVETEEEWYCLVKTEKRFYPQVEQAIKELHPYEVAEIIAVPIIAGSPSYLEWVSDNIRSSE